MYSFKAIIRQVLICLIIIIPCQAASPENSQAPAAEYQAAMFVPTKTPFWRWFVSYAETAAAEIGLNLQIHQRDDDREQLLAQVKEACKQGVDAILFMEYDGTGEAILQIAEEYATPAFLVNTALNDSSLLPRSR